MHKFSTLKGYLIEYTVFQILWENNNICQQLNSILNVIWYLLSICVIDLNCSFLPLQTTDPLQSGGVMSVPKRSVLPESVDIKRIRSLQGSAAKQMDRYKPVDKDHADSIVNFLLRMACQVQIALNFKFPTTVF